MSKINYLNWLNGNDCCKQHSDCDCDHQECDCENILLEISKLHIDDNLIKDDLYDLSGKTTSGITITVDPTLDSGSTNAVANSAITVAINSKADKNEIPTVPTSNSAFTNDMGYITNNDLDNALSGKQDTLIAGTNITISGNVISAQGGGSIDIDPSLDSGSTNAVANSAITAALNGKADKGEIPTIPTNVSAFNNDAGYITSSALNGYATEQWVENKGYLTEHQSLNNYYTKSETSGATQISTALASKADTATTYTKSEVDTALSGKQDVSGMTAYATSSDVESYVSGYTYDKATIDSKVASGGTFDPTQYYTKTATDALLDDKFDASAFTSYSAATDTALASKQTTLTAGTGISIVDNVISATGGGVTVDDALNATSENPVQNKVIYAVIGDIESLLSNI